AIRLAGAPGPVHRVLESHGKTWARDNGAKISLVPPGESADLVVLSPPEMPSWAAADRLLPLPDATVTAAFQPLYRSRLVNWDNRTYALPILGDGFVFVFRADLYADAALQAAFKRQRGTELTPPATWQDVAVQAAFFAAKRGRPSLPPLPADDPGLDRAFGAIAAPMTVRAATGSSKNSTDDDLARL